MPEAHERRSSIPWRPQSGGQSRASEAQEGMDGGRGQHVGLGNQRLFHKQSHFDLALSSPAATTAVRIAHPLAFMSDRKRALEENGPSSASKKARRSVFVCYSGSCVLALTLSFQQ
jgi:hypothetical protein